MSGFKDWKMSDVNAYNQKVASKRISPVVMPPNQSASLQPLVDSGEKSRDGINDLPTRGYNGNPAAGEYNLAVLKSPKSSGAMSAVGSGSQKKRKPSYTEEGVRKWCQENGLPEPFFEEKFHPVRKWRFDIAFAQPTNCINSQTFELVWKKVALEVQGQIWFKGGHSSGAGIRRDWEKLHEAQILGWKMVYCEPKTLLTKETAEIVRRMLNS